MARAASRINASTLLVSQVPLFVLSRLLSSLWVSRTGSTSDWCALQGALYKCIDTIKYITTNDPLGVQPDSSKPSRCLRKNCVLDWNLQNLNDGQHAYYLHH